MKTNKNRYFDNNNVVGQCIKHNINEMTMMGMLRDMDSNCRNFTRISMQWIVTVDLRSESLNFKFCFTR